MPHQGSPPAAGGLPRRHQEQGAAELRRLPQCHDNSRHEQSFHGAISTFPGSLTAGEQLTEAEIEGEAPGLGSLLSSASSHAGSSPLRGFLAGNPAAGLTPPTFGPVYASLGPTPALIALSVGWGPPGRPGPS